MIEFGKNVIPGFIRRNQWHWTVCLWSVCVQQTKFQADYFLWSNNPSQFLFRNTCDQSNWQVSREETQQSRHSRRSPNSIQKTKGEIHWSCVRRLLFRVAREAAFRRSPHGTEIVYFVGLRFGESTNRSSMLGSFANSWTRGSEKRKEVELDSKRMAPPKEDHTFSTAARPYSRLNFSMRFIQTCEVLEQIRIDCKETVV